MHSNNLETPIHDRITKSAPERYVFCERPRCPACGSPDLEAKRTIDRSREAVSRRTLCRGCGHRFILVLE